MVDPSPRGGEPDRAAMVGLTTRNVSSDQDHT